MSRVFNKLLYGSAALLAFVLLLPSCATTQLHATPPVQHYQGSDARHQSPAHAQDAALTVMTLNVAHGRGTGFHQMLQGTDDTRRNLDSINRLLKRLAPDVIALQEVDGPCFWSGNFNHVDYLASGSLFRRSVQAAHVDAMGLYYGTAMLSRLELSRPRAVTFAPSLTPVPKGFVVSTIGWPGRDGVDIDVVSVHLDFMSRSIRREQADELIALLRARNNRLVVMGDLNAEWHQPDSVVQYLVAQLGLTAYQPENRKLITFPALGERLDWILISPGIEFSSYDVVGNRVSDHRGIVARLRLAAR